MNVELRETDFTLRKKNAKELAAGYTRKKRFMEYCYLSVGSFLWFTQFIIVARYFVHSGEVSKTQLLLSFFSFISAMFCAEFIGGLAHWAFDTWGSPKTFFFGTFIRSFREHHVDQSAITRHDFVETNADTMLPLIPVLLLQRYFIYCTNEHGKYPYNIHPENVAGHVFLLIVTLFVAITNEIHKWAHQKRPHVFARVLIFCNIVLNPIVHRKHHSGNYDCSYCITTGWMNWYLDKINFWRKAEAVITALTGAIPRANDKKLLGA